jgi:hypothetical protein
MKRSGLGQGPAIPRSPFTTAGYTTYTPRRRNAFNIILLGTSNKKVGDESPTFT